MEIKVPEPSEWTEINEFLTKNLRANVTWSMKDEYPLAFSESNHGNMRIVRENNQVVAHAVLQTHLIKTPYHLFKVGFIGSVVTAEGHRNKGYSTQILESCLHASREQGCDFAMLWTDMFNFYAKMGFEIAGNEVALEIPTTFQAPAKESLRFMETCKIAPEAVLRLYNKHSLRTLRRTEDIQKYLQIPQAKVYSAWNKITGQLEAYCVTGKGVDFSNYIHEWGGSVSALVATLQHMVQTEKKSLTLITPPQCTNLISRLETLGAEKFLGVLAMVKIVNPVSFCKKIKKGVRALGYDNFVLEYHHEKFFFGCGDDIYQTDREQDITRLVFGPVLPGQVHRFSPATLEVFNDVFPIPFWVWGWDSI